jgi:hypothetical protein
MNFNINTNMSSPYLYQTVFLRGGKVPTDLTDLRWYKVEGRIFGVRLTCRDDYLRLYSCPSVIPNPGFIDPRPFGEDEELLIY